MCSSIQFSSISSCSGVNPTAPSTPKPPALLTATTTSRQWVKAKMGNSMPSCVAEIGVHGALLGRSGKSGKSETGPGPVEIVRNAGASG